MNPTSDPHPTLSKQGFSFRETGFFGQIILDYLDDKPELKPFYGLRSSAANFGKQVQLKGDSYQHRDVLHTALKAQYGRSGIKCPGIDKLLKSNTYAVTTGHQVCLFTGPAYFIWKILTAVRTCKALDESYPDSEFVPVFWMATEDHDFEEANHFNVHGKRFEWESGQGGAVGRMETTGLDEIAEELEEFLGVGYQSGELNKLFKDAYLKHNNIADATRCLVHSLFADYGVVVIDGDDPTLKRLMVPIFKDELLNETSSKAVRSASEQLSATYSLQVSPREINLFYLEGNIRSRIEREADGTFTVVNTALKWPESEILMLLDDHPERFSPNVILRPLYQEVILPNLAYVGGGGELAYWFQLKEIFDNYGVSFPILMLRNSVEFIDLKVQTWLNELGLSTTDIFKPRIEIENRLLLNKAATSLRLQGQRELMEQLFLEIEKQMIQVDPNLSRSIKSGFVKAEKILASLEKKMLRSERRKQAELTEKLDKIFSALFPGGGLQERNVSFAEIQLELGDGFLNRILECFPPFDPEFILLASSAD